MSDQQRKSHILRTTGTVGPRNCHRHGFPLHFVLTNISSQVIKGHLGPLCPCPFLFIIQHRPLLSNLLLHTISEPSLETDLSELHTECKPGFVCSSDRSVRQEQDNDYILRIINQDNRQSTLRPANLSEKAASGLRHSQSCLVPQFMQIRH
jgi:hypothetical protein